MEIKQFSWMFKQSEFQLDAFECDFDQHQRAYEEMVVELQYPSPQEQFLVSIFNETRKNEEILNRNPNEAYWVFIVEKNEQYQVEIRHPNTKLPCNVNGGAGELLFTMDQMKRFCSLLDKHCNILQFFTGKTSKNLPVFTVKRNKNRKLMYTNKLCFDAFLEDTASFEQFKEIIEASLTDEKKEELAFFQLELNYKKMWKKHRKQFFISKWMGQPVSIFHYIKRDNGVYTISIDLNFKGWEFYYEYS